MATLYFVRHGQASFGADDYDQLSALGKTQAEALGAHWAERGLSFGAVFRGSLKRHHQTLDGLLLGADTVRAQLAGDMLQPGAGAGGQARTGKKVPNMHFVQHPRHLYAINNIANIAIKPDAATVVTPALNEYDSEALIRARLALHPQVLPPATTPEGYKAHFRVLRDALGDWIAGHMTPASMPSFEQFRGGIADVMNRVRAEHGANSQANVLVVSSGGPISTAVMHALNAPANAMIDLNYQMRNTAVTCFQVSRQKVTLSGFNHLPHLDVPGRETWVTST